MDNCCLHHKETLRKPEVASLVIKAFVDEETSMDQANKVCIYKFCNLTIDLSHIYDVMSLLPYGS